MSSENNKQNITLAEMGKDIKYIIDRLDKLIESYNGKFRMTDDRITREVGANKILIDNHCSRIRFNEQRLTSLEPIKKLYDKMAAASFGIMVALGMAVIGLAYTIAEKFKH